VQYLWQEVFVTQSLLNDFYWSMGGTMIAFVLGSFAGVLVGMLFVTSPIDGSGVQPDLHALNAMPRLRWRPCSSSGSASDSAPRSQSASASPSSSC
jgi:ABC-type nitrate/sulfonate/bicarbonate transport system, permease component